MKRELWNLQRLMLMLFLRLYFTLWENLSSQIFFFFKIKINLLEYWNTYMHIAQKSSSLFWFEKLQQVIFLFPGYYKGKKLSYFHSDAKFWFLWLYFCLQVSGLILKRLDMQKFLAIYYFGSFDLNSKRNLEYKLVQKCRSVFFRIRPSIYGSIRRFVSIIPYYMYPKMGYIPLSVERHRIWCCFSHRIS